MQHHRFTNHDASKDPDHYTQEGPSWQRLPRWASIDLYYLVFYLRHWGKRPARERREELIGLGLMGNPMGHNLLKAGFPLTVWNRTAVYNLGIPSAIGANGTGTSDETDCLPDCSRGRRYQFPIVVRAENPITPSGPSCPGGVQFYSDLLVAYPNATPPWLQPNGR